MAPQDPVYNCYTYKQQIDVLCGRSFHICGRSRDGQHHSLYQLFPGRRHSLKYSSHGPEPPEPVTPVESPGAPTNGFRHFRNWIFVPLQKNRRLGLRGNQAPPLARQYSYH